VSKVNLDEVLKVGQAGLGLWMEKFKLRKTNPSRKFVCLFVSPPVW
jgi:hypothetical protein